MVGLASALAVAHRGRTVCMLEKEPRPGMATSTHNSQVIHAGIYYPAGSLKARHCIEGARRLYEFCATYGVPHRRCGKLIVAYDESEIPALEQLRVTGQATASRDSQSSTQPPFAHANHTSVPLPPCSPRTPAFSKRRRLSARWHGCSAMRAGTCYPVRRSSAARATTVQSNW